jgi:hypothetical protein
MQKYNANAVIHVQDTFLWHDFYLNKYMFLIQIQFYSKLNFNTLKSRSYNEVTRSYVS